MQCPSTSSSFLLINLLVLIHRDEAMPAGLRVLVVPRDLPASYPKPEPHLTEALLVPRNQARLNPSAGSALLCPGCSALIPDALRRCPQGCPFHPRPTSTKTISAGLNH